MRRLDSLRKVRIELQTLYNLYKQDKIDSRRLRDSVYCLTSIGDLLISSDIEQRIEMLEKNNMEVLTYAKAIN